MEKKEAARLVNKRRLAKVSDYQKTFSTPHGKKVLLDLINAHSMMQPTFHENSHVMACREGERMVIIRILGILKTSAEKIKKLLEENHDVQQSQSIIG